MTNFAEQSDMIGEGKVADPCAPACKQSTRQMTSPPPGQSDAEQAARWENEGGHLQSPTSLEGLGITRVLTETFLVGDYRYTALADAVAQAHRMIARSAR